MLRNFFKLAWRNLVRHRGYAAINIAGLTIGLTCALLIIVYIRFEVSFDRYHEKADRIFRLTREFLATSQHFARCPDDFIADVDAELPAIERLVRFRTPFDNIDLRIGEQNFREQNWFITDPYVFDVFDFQLKKGDKQKALSEPNSVLLSESMAAKYFGNLDPIGKEIYLLGDVQNEIYPYQITGILADTPENSHFHINFLASWRNPEERYGWAYTYVLLKEGNGPSALSEKLPEIIDKHLGADASDSDKIHLQPLTDIHLHSNLLRDLEPGGDMTYLWIFLAVAILTVLIAVINYINLSTARGMERAREIGIRKVLGSSRTHLAWYFLTESLLLVIFASFVALCNAELLLPFFKGLAAKNLELNLFQDSNLLWIWIGIVGATGLLAGSYPALALPAISPVSVLKSNFELSAGRRVRISGVFLRKSLLTLQFAIAIGLIIATLVSLQQFRYLQSKKLGLEKEQVIALKGISTVVKSRFHVLKNELSGIAGVIGVSAAMEKPSGELRDRGFIYVEGLYEGEDTPFLNVLPVDEDFIPLMGIDLLAGNNFPKSGTAVRLTEVEDWRARILDVPRSYILNQAALKQIGWDSPDEAIGKRFRWANNDFALQIGPVIGVTRDFHFSSLRKQVDPIVMVYEPVWFGSVLVKVAPTNIKSTLEGIEKTWKGVYPDRPFEYAFLDDMFATLYQSEQRQGKLLTIFSCMAMSIACFGLFGLAAFLVRRRTKEVGVRKVCGATTREISTLLMRDFIKWVLIANFVAVPVAWYAMTTWLQNFAYRIDITWWIFAASGALALFVALSSVSWQTFKAASANPVEALRHE